jgi:hypothetical protein
LTRTVQNKGDRETDSALKAQNICRNPSSQGGRVRKSSVHDHEVSLSHDRSR